MSRCESCGQKVTGVTMRCRFSSGDTLRVERSCQGSSSCAFIYMESSNDGEVGHAHLTKSDTRKLRDFLNTLIGDDA